MPRKPSYTVIRGGRLLDIAKRSAPPADILIKGDTVAEIGKPGLEIWSEGPASL
jgi:5-methylthioadenosine/S-adenosylhomocysteine deaminase